MDNGAKRVLVSAPVTGGPSNIVMGVNHESFNPKEEPIITAASCTTNCLAPVVRVLHDAIGIEHGLVTSRKRSKGRRGAHRSGFWGCDDVE